MKVAMKSITLISLICMLCFDLVLADVPVAASGGQSLLSVLPMILILIFFMYFMVIRPQSKKAKEHKNLIGNLKENDEVMTIGGILGKIEKISDDFVLINVAPDVTISFQKSAVSHLVPKGTIDSVKK